MRQSCYSGIKIKQRHKINELIKDTKKLIKRTVKKETKRCRQVMWVEKKGKSGKERKEKRKKKEIEN